MVDVVANHMGATGFGNLYPFNEASHYHRACDITDYNNQWMVEQCRIGNLFWGV